MDRLDKCDLAAAVHRRESTLGDVPILEVALLGPFGVVATAKHHVARRVHLGDLVAEPERSLGAVAPCEDFVRHRGERDGVLAATRDVDQLRAAQGLDEHRRGDDVCPVRRGQSMLARRGFAPRNRAEGPRRGWRAPAARAVPADAQLAVVAEPPHEERPAGEGLVAPLLNELGVAVRGWQEPRAVPREVVVGRRVLRQPQIGQLAPLEHAVVPVHVANSAVEVRVADEVGLA